MAWFLVERSNKRKVGKQMSRYVANQTSIGIKSIPIYSQIDKCVTWYTKSFYILHKSKTFNDQSIQPSSPARKWKNLTAKVVKAGKLRELGKYTLLNTTIRTWIERSREVKVWDENKQDGSWWIWQRILRYYSVFGVLRKPLCQETRECGVEWNHREETGFERVIRWKCGWSWRVWKLI